MSWLLGRIYGRRDTPRRLTVVLVGWALVYVFPWSLPTPPRFGG